MFGEVYQSYRREKDVNVLLETAYQALELQLLD